MVGAVFTGRSTWSCLV